MEDVLTDGRRDASITLIGPASDAARLIVSGLEGARRATLKLSIGWRGARSGGCGQTVWRTVVMASRSDVNKPGRPSATGRPNPNDGVFPL